MLRMRCLSYESCPNSRLDLACPDMDAPGRACSAPPTPTKVTAEFKLERVAGMPRYHLPALAGPGRGGGLFDSQSDSQAGGRSRMPATTSGSNPPDFPVGEHLRTAAD